MVVVILSVWPEATDVSLDQTCKRPAGRAVWKPWYANADRYCMQTSGDGIEIVYFGY